ncbi:MAG: hypothetical protein CMF96_11965 [Candidatus Marinimicrobia bacterium]|nr:hypothetical protein [Candidatus Neomarinimicrobiota bacterium]|tara:strand:- start:716 stop:1597 length:882 start_codon:yes stop_codon:yes gene_type:complete
MNKIELIISVLCLLICLSIASIIPVNTNGIDRNILINIVGIVFIIHLILFIPSYILKTEKYFDITGTIAYLSIILFINYEFHSNNIELSFQSKLVSTIVLIWALRLGLFLYFRILKFKNDVRFDEAKKSFFKYLRFWMISSLWVFLTTLNATTLIINNQKQINITLLTTGIILWLVGFIIEFIADYQKFKFKNKESNKNKFIETGIWSYSQHPNYFGEITMWIGISIISLGSLFKIQFFTLVSPLFVYLLLTKVSGINLLEENAKVKWGQDKDYINYFNNTPKLIPNFFKKRA